MNIKRLLTILLLLLGILNSAAQSQQEEEEAIRNQINRTYKQALTECVLEVNTITTFNEKKEFWSICQLKNGNRILKIASHDNDIYYEEIYFEKEGMLIYAKETENVIPKNHFTQMTWHCEFYIRNGALLTLISLGHGKTEDENWDPDSIFDSYKKRLAELKKIKQ